MTKLRTQFDRRNARQIRHSQDLRAPGSRFACNQVTDPQVPTWTKTADVIWLTFAEMASQAIQEAMQEGAHCQWRDECIVTQQCLRWQGHMAQQIETANVPATPRQRSTALSSDRESGDQKVTQCGNRPLRGKLRARKVAKRRPLSPLAQWIIRHAEAGIARSAIAEGFYGIEPLYCGHYVDPCLSAKARHDRQSKCRHAQPVITKMLKHLEGLGLVPLIRDRRYIKAIQLTPKGQRLANELRNTSEVAGQ